MRNSSSSLTLPRLATALLLAIPCVLSACAGGDEQSVSSTNAATGECPTSPVDVVVSVDQWGDIVSQLGGACAKVTTVLVSSSVDPHDFEPGPSDAALFNGAQLVVINGGHYDEWAAKLAAASAPNAPVVNAFGLSGEHEASDGHADAGDAQAQDGNVHVWYRPATVTLVAEAVTAELGKLAPDAAGYFDGRHTAFNNVMAPYYETIAAIRSGAAGKSFAATESVFDDMAAALGLQNRTPEGYQLAAANETDPAPADLDTFLRLLGDRGVDVLIYNTQTEGSVPEKIRAAAEEAGIPVVDVTETVPAGASSFQTWQVGQLDSLAEALGIPV